MAHQSPTKSAPMVKKGPWSQIEDDMLMHLVAVYGPEQWMEISKDHGTRNAKQCRERYHQNLKPTINRGPITAEEGVVIERLQADKGPKWADIARAIGGRSENQVKNWYNGQKNRRSKMHTHSGQHVIYRGGHHSLSAVKPVDLHILQQRGHVNPYFQGNFGYVQNSRPSPTASQISEAPSLVSDASSTSPGISPSSLVALPACPNVWHSPGDSARSNLPFPYQLPSLLPIHPSAAAAASYHASTNLQSSRPMTLEQRKELSMESLDCFHPPQRHSDCESRHHGKVSCQAFQLTEPTPAQLPPVQSLLMAQHDHLASNIKPSDASPPPIGPQPDVTAPSPYRSDSGRDGLSDKLDKPARSHLRAMNSNFSRQSSRHAPYPSCSRLAAAATVSATHDSTKGRMSLANVLG